MNNRSVPLEDFRTFGELLKLLRRRAQLSQRELAIAVGYSESQISRLETNLRAPDSASLMALFVPALQIENEPETIQRMFELAEQGQEKTSGQTAAERKAVHPHNLPTQLTSFIGREKEIAALRQMMCAGQTRLVTLTGSGGVGKTRLAIRVAEEALDDFSDGAWFVDLAPLTDPGLVAQIGATTLGVLQAPGQTATIGLCERIGSKHMLLILDNCEQVISTVAVLAETLLRTCPHLCILATSREILGISGETLYRCPSLSLPDPKHLLPPADWAQSEAVLLFNERARAVSPNFYLTDANAALIAQVCHRLDGIPLAIELAAARMRLLSIEQLADRLDNVFQLLSGGSRTALLRHQTIRALIDWSYNLLPEKERQLLLRLSVFAGGWTLEAAERVCVDSPAMGVSAASSAEVICADQGEGGLVGAEILHLLGQLVDKSLVIVADGPGKHSRYRMLETIRQYARERIPGGEWAEVRTRHLDTFLALVLQSKSHLRGKGQRIWLDRLEVELDNIRQALEWALEKDVYKGLQIAAALEWFWHIRNHVTEGIGWLDRFLTVEANTVIGQQRSAAQSAIRGKALNALANILTNWIDNEKAIPLLEEARAIFLANGNQGEFAKAIFILAFTEKDLDRAIAGTLQALNIFRREGGDQAILSDILLFLGQLYISKGTLHKAREYIEETLQICGEMEDEEGKAAAQWVFGLLELVSGNHDQAEALFFEGQTSFDTSGNQVVSGMLSNLLGYIAMIRGDSVEAVKRNEAAYAAAVRLDNKPLMGMALSYLGWEAWDMKEYERAIMYCEKALTLRGFQEYSWISPEYVLGRVALSKREYRQARGYLKKLTLSASKLNSIISLHYHSCSAMNALGVLATALNQARRAATIFGAQDALNGWFTTILSPIERDEYEQALAAARSALGKEAFTAAWEEGRAMTLDQAIQYALAEEAV